MMTHGAMAICNYINVEKGAMPIQELGQFAKVNGSISNSLIGQT